MTQIIWRSLLAFSLAMALSACQAPAKQISEPVIDQFAVSAQVFDTYVEGNQLVAAEQQLQTLGADYSDDERLPALQQRLAAAWLKNGQQALQNADVLAASTALMHAKRLMPQAPALTEGLSTALAEVQAQVVPPVVEQEIVKPVVKRPAAAKPAPRVPARKIATPIKTAPAVTVIEPTVMEPKLEQAPLATTKPRSKKARIIDPLADSTTLPMPMLASRND
ncbi:MAG: hypothetical protein KAZ03_03630, partial [Thiopseudomonas sp.]|nr:hypothetical protein [Thiopseudomonas sp.]